MEREFSGGLVVRTLHFHFRGTDLIPGWGIKIPYAVLPGRKKKKKKKVPMEKKRSQIGERQAAMDYRTAEGTMT